MLGDLIYEGQGKIIDTRLVNAEENKIKHTLEEEGKFKDIQVTITSTFWTVPTGKDTVYGEADASIITNYDKEIASYKRCGIGHSMKQGITIFRAINFYKTLSNGKLSFLNNTVGAVEAEAHYYQHSGKVWEWK